MARKVIIEKWKKEPKYKTGAYARYRICGRPHSILKKFGICRIRFGELVYKGQIPGCKKASWQETDVVKGDTLNGYDRSYRRFASTY